MSKPQSFLNILLCAFAFITTTNSKIIHKCAQNHLHKDKDHSTHLRQSHVQYNNHPFDNHIHPPNTRRLSEQSQPSPIRINPYYDSRTISTRNGLTEEQISYIKSLISASLRFYNKFLSVIPVHGNLYLHRQCIRNYTTEFGTNCVEYLKPDQCGMADIPSDHMAEDLLYFWPRNTSATKLPAGTG